MLDFAVARVSYLQLGNVTIGYNRADILSAAQENTGLPFEARNEYGDGWMEVIFNCVDGENIEALKFCTDGDVCKENNGGTGAECKVDL